MFPSLKKKNPSELRKISTRTYGVTTQNLPFIVTAVRTSNVSFPHNIQIIKIAHLFLWKSNKQLLCRKICNSNNLTHSTRLCNILKKKKRIWKIAYFNTELHKIYGSCIICFAAAYGAVNRVTYKTWNCRALEVYVQSYGRCHIAVRMRKLEQNTK